MFPKNELTEETLFEILEYLKQFMSFEEKSVAYWELVIDAMAIIEGLLPSVNTKTGIKIADDLMHVTRKIDTFMPQASIALLYPITFSHTYSAQ